jgi:hypothetical protein
MYAITPHSWSELDSWLTNIEPACPSTGLVAVDAARAGQVHEGDVVAVEDVALDLGEATRQREREAVLVGLEYARQDARRSVLLRLLEARSYSAVPMPLP